MSTLTFAVIGLIGAALPAIASAQGQSTAVYINNNSSQTITNVYLSPVGNDKWGDDRLGNDTLAARQRVQLDPGMRNGCSYDVRVIYADKQTEEKRNQNLCELNDITFTGPNSEINTAIEVVNASSLMIHFLYISPTGNSDWGRDWLGENTGLAPGTRGKVNPGRDAGCNYDLRVIYENKQTEEKRNQNLCELEEVVFGAGAASGNPADPRPASLSFGTGFFVTGDGYALTNHHVVEDCRTISVVTDRGALPARVVRLDETNDLALLFVEKAGKVGFANFRASPGIRPGDGVVVAGFPLPTVLQNGLNVTVGNVSSLAGAGGNTALLQVTAPVQPGNSGGPLLDMAGNVVGVIVSKLNALEIMKATGDVPQNINFAVQGTIARLFLEAQGVKATEKSSASTLAVGDVVDNARAFTYQIECRP